VNFLPVVTFLRRGFPDASEGAFPDTNFRPFPIEPPRGGFHSEHRNFGWRLFTAVTIFGLSVLSSFSEATPLRERRDT